MRINFYSKLDGFLMLLLSAIVVMVFQTLNILNDITLRQIRQHLSTLDNVELFQSFEDVIQTYETTDVSVDGRYFLTPTTFESGSGGTRKFSMHMQKTSLLQKGTLLQGSISAPLWLAFSAAPRISED